MTDTATGKPIAGTVDTSGERLFDSLVRAREVAGPLRRAVAGLRDGDRWTELSYDDLINDVETLSAHLADLGLRAGDVLCVQLPNWVEAVLYTYAAARLGAVVCPVTTIYRRRELDFVLRRTRCRIVVVPASYRRFDYAEMVQEMADDLPDLQHVVCVGDSIVDGVVSSSGLFETTSSLTIPPSFDGSVDEPAILAFTSGTTGEPKGVMHSAASMHAAIDDVVDHTGYGSGLTSLVMSPFGHLTGFTWGIMMPLRGAGDVVLLETWNPESALELIERYAVTFTMGATPFLSDLLDAADRADQATFPDVFVCGGAPIPPSLVQRAVREHGCRVVAVWGMSEYPVGTATTVHDDPVQATVSDGRPAGRAEVLVVDPAGDRVQVGQEGDVVIGGPGRFLGYYKRPDLDADALTSAGLLRTGDRARLLDSDGHIRISGRTKDIIIRGGENIPVLEIENLLATHPLVREVALVPVPHDRLGETACACIVARSDPGEALSVTELGAFLAERGVAKQFYPESVQVMSELPRTPSGKIQKFALRDQVATAQRSS